jgi:ABC-2 type transport system permease protein
MIQDVITVYVAEVARRIKSRPFIVSLLVGAFGIAFLIRSPALIRDSYTANRIVLMGNASLTARAQPMLSHDFRIAAVLPAQAVDGATLRSYRADAAIALASGARGLSVMVFARDPGTLDQSDVRSALLPLQLELTTHRSADVVKQITEMPIEVQAVGSKFSSARQSLAVRGIAYTLIFLLYLLIMLNSQLVMSSVAEEKTSRIAELLVSSVNPIALLSGKILASATLGLVQLTAWVTAAVVFGGGAGSSTAASSHGADVITLNGIFDIITPGVLGAFVVFFVIGFLQLSLLFASGASLINRTEDLGAIALPLVFPLVSALIIATMALGTPDTPLSVVGSFVPILAPFVMFARIAVSNVPVWQLALSLAINLGAVYVIALMAGKIYRVGMILYGRSPNVGQIWSVIRS